MKSGYFRMPLAIVLLISLHGFEPTVMAQTAAPRRFVTQHQGTFNGQPIRYTATVSETILKDEAASIFSTSYVRDGVTDKARRPVIFAFNGGPGAASVWLHMGALGPKRVLIPADPNAEIKAPYTVVDNPYALLDVADVVLIDPVETGYSRLLPGAKRESFFTAAGDAKAVAQFIQAWSKANGREASPKYLVGESYGTIRAVIVAEELAKAGRDAALDGVVLLGQAVNIVETVQRAGNAVGYAVNLPALTAIAWYHNRINREGRTLEGVLDESYAFALSEYLPALARGRELSEAERQRIAQRLYELSGVSAAWYLTHDLQITKERFREELLKDKGLIVGRYDARYVSTEADPGAKLSPPYESAVKEHLTKTLGVKLTDDYRAINRSLAEAWDYGGPRSPFADYDFAGAFARVMRTQPHLRLLVGTGLYDTTTTTGAARYLLARYAFPSERVISRQYEGGHMFYSNEAALKAFAADLRAFVTTPTLDVAVRPVRGGQAEVAAVEFRMELRGALHQNKPFSLQSPITYAGRTGIADRVDGLVVKDAAGIVPLRIENDPVNPSGFPFYRHWRAQRAVVAPVTVNYRMLSFTGEVKPGPQFDFYSHNGGISSGGMALFVLPENIGAAAARVKWDLSDLAAGSIAASTYGEGDFDVRGSLDQLWQAYYMAGPLGRYAPSESGSGFSGYWLGKPAFDPQKELAWAQQSYEYQRKFFRDTTTSSYRVFIRALPGTGGGTALQTSFMLGTAPGDADPNKQGPRNTLAHEMGHYWVGGLSGGGVGGVTWFAEGLNVYYTRLLLLRSGLGALEDYLRDINQNARDYFTNPYKNHSAEELARLGFSAGVGTGSAQRVPYMRGSMYFSEVDARIRAASSGKRKLDDVMLPLFERRRRGEEISQEDLLDALVKELGPAARAQFEAVIIRGETIVPESGAFGPCFERKPTKVEVQGKEVEGYEWTRVTTVPEARCREW